MDQRAWCTGICMKWYPLVAGLLIITLLTAGCSDESGEPGDIIPTPTLQEPRYIAGDIVSKIGPQEEPLWLILGYDSTNDTYERAFVYKKADGTWGYRKDSRTDIYPRADLESLYRVKVAHVKPSLVPVLTQTPVTETIAVTAESAPEITGIVPESGATGSMVIITDLSGKHFVSGATVTLAGAGSPAITATGVRNTGTRITCVFDLGNATPGKRDIIVTNPDGQAAVLANGFTINNPAPSIGSIDPYEGAVGQTLTITITGINFKSPAMVYFVKDGRELEAGNVQVKNTNLLTTALAIPADVEAGTWGVIVRNVIDKQNSTTIRKFIIRNAT